MLILHKNYLENSYKNVPLKFFLQTFKYSFKLDYAFSVLAIVGMPFILIFLYINHYFYVEFSIKPYLDHIRGVNIASINWLKRKTSNKKMKQLQLCGVNIPKDVENLHFMIAGSTGTGKSTILNELIASSIYRGDKVIVIDPNGGFLSKFYQEGDKILNPFDARSEIWDAFFDIKNDNYDFEQIVMSIIPPATGSAEEWNGYARTLLRGLMKACKNSNKSSMHDIIEMLNTTTNDDLKEFVSGTEAEALFAIAEGSNSNNTINSTRFVLAKYISVYQYLPKNIGFGFSIKDYINNGKGNLFITWREDMIQALKPLISTWCDIVASAILSAENTQNILFVIDELDTLNQLPALEHLATKGRKHGLNIIACIQSTAQLDATYGRDKAIALRSCFRNLVVLGGSKTDDKTANDLSNALGEHEVIRLDKSESYQNNTRKKVAFKEKIVLPSEIQALKQLNGYLAFALDYPVVKFKIDRVDYPIRTQNYIEK
jgi:type IV secretory pathway TraG/TraD family ATPase VirD4